MPANYPKFDKKIQEQIDINNMKMARSRPGMIMSYSKSNNMATVLLDEQYSGTMGSVIRDVPCPINMGIQTTAPTVGTRCLVAFRDGNESSPYILNYFEDNLANSNYYRNNFVDTGVPRFMV